MPTPSSLMWRRPRLAPLTLLFAACPPWAVTDVHAHEWIFGAGFEPGVVAFSPSFSAVPAGSAVSSTFPDSLVVVLDSPSAEARFIPIASAAPERLSVVGGGVLVGAGEDAAEVRVDAGSAAAAPVTLRLDYGARLAVAVRVEQAMNESDTPAEADYCALQFPLQIASAPAASLPAIYGQLYEPDTTEAAGAAPGWIAELGIGPLGTTPAQLAGWRFATAPYNLQVGNNDEYVAASAIAPASVGKYAYAFRFSHDGGGSWTYCDTDGAGSGAGLSFSPASLGTLTVSE
jgi:hypothetical protein